jgi:hypothetical protein
MGGTLTADVREIIEELDADGGSVQAASPIRCGVVDWAIGDGLIYTASAASRSDRASPPREAHPRPDGIWRATAECRSPAAQNHAGPPLC